MSTLYILPMKYILPESLSLCVCVCVYHASMVLYETRSLNSLKLLFFSDIFALMKETLSAVEIAIWKGRKSITN